MTTYFACKRKKSGFEDIREEKCIYFYKKRQFGITFFSFIKCTILFIIIIYCTLYCTVLHCTLYWTAPCTALHTVYIFLNKDTVPQRLNDMPMCAQWSGAWVCPMVWCLCVPNGLVPECEKLNISREKCEPAGSWLDNSTIIIIIYILFNFLTYTLMYSVHCNC